MLPRRCNFLIITGRLHVSYFIVLFVCIALTNRFLFLALGVADIFLRPRASAKPATKVDKTLMMDKVFLFLCSIGLLSGPGFYVPIFYVPGTSLQYHNDGLDNSHLAMHFIILDSFSQFVCSRLCHKQTGTQCSGWCKCRSSHIGIFRLQVAW